MRVTKNRVVIRRLLDSLSINVSLDSKQDLCVELAEDLVKALKKELIEKMKQEKKFS